MDETGKVRGGFYIPSTPEDKEWLYHTFVDMAATMGYDPAHDAFMNLTGHMSFAYLIYGGKKLMQK